MFNQFESSLKLVELDCAQSYIFLYWNQSRNYDRKGHHLKSTYLKYMKI